VNRKKKQETAHVFNLKMEHFQGNLKDNLFLESIIVQ
jgi:hypothetical protein